MSCSETKFSNEKGFAMITVVIFTWMLCAFVLSYFDILVGERRLIQSSENRLMAESLAEAGAEEVAWEYSYGGANFQSGEGWSGSSTKTKTVASFTDTSGNTVGSYTISVANWNGSAPIATVTATLSAPGTATQATVKTGFKTDPIFGAAIKAQEEVEFDSNAITDSYNSVNGDYGGANIYQNGDVITNSTDTPAISLDFNSWVKGDAGTGTGGTVVLDSRVTGSISSSTNETFTIPTVPSYLTILPSLGDMTTNTILPGGIYHYDKINLGSAKTLTILTNTEIYLSHNSGDALSMGNFSEIALAAGASLVIYTDGGVNLGFNVDINTANGTDTPLFFTINGTATCASVQSSSEVDFVGTINAPQADFHFGSNTLIYGAIIADEVDLDSFAAIHYDENLATSGPSLGYELAWSRRTS
jgi:hypothetical protein